jgi:type IV secretory pathway TraG/TraD family ATPase VirD4
MNAMRNGSRNGAKPAGSGKSGDKRPLLHLAENDPFTVAHSFEHLFGTGQTGGGKTTGPGQAFALAMLRHGYGFLVTTTKPGEAQQWVEWARLAGREDDVRIFSPQEPWRFSLLDYCYRQGGSRGAGETDNVVALLGELLEFKNRNGTASGDHQFWIDMAKKVLGHIIDLLACAGEPISFGGINKVLQSLPYSLEEVRSKEWQDSSFTNQLVDRAIASSKLSAIQQKDLGLGIEYLLSVVPRMDDRLRSGIIASLDSIIYPFMRGQLGNLCGGEKSTLTPEDSFAGAIIILDVPIKEFHQTGQFIQVLWKRLWQQAAEKRDLEKFLRPLCLFSDEAQNFVTRYDPLFIATARSARIATVLMTQNLDGLQSAIGKSETEALLGNFNTKVFCCNAHVATNEFAAKTIGQHWGLSGSVNMSLGGQGGMSGGSNEQLKYRVEPAEFIGLKSGGEENNCLVEAIIFRSGRPFRATNSNHLRAVFSQNIDARPTSSGRNHHHATA